MNPVDVFEANITKNMYLINVLSNDQLNTTPTLDRVNLLSRTLWFQPQSWMGFEVVCHLIYIKFFVRNTIYNFLWGPSRKYKEYHRIWLEITQTTLYKHKPKWEIPLALIPTKLRSLIFFKKTDFVSLQRKIFIP